MVQKIENVAVCWKRRGKRQHRTKRNGKKHQKSAEERQEDPEKALLREAHSQDEKERMERYDTGR